MNKVDLSKGLDNSTRLRILDSLRNKNQCNCNINPLTSKSQPKVSHPIKIQKNPGIINTQPTGTNIFITASNKDIFEIIGITRLLNE